MSCGVGRMRGLDPALLWRRQAGAALIQPLAWELSYFSAKSTVARYVWASDVSEVVSFHTLGPL